jgi:hypothetical protein
MAPKWYEPQKNRGPVEALDDFDGIDTLQNLSKRSIPCSATHLDMFLKARKRKKE